MKIIKVKKEWDNLLAEYFGGYNDVFFNYDYFDLYARHYESSLEAIFWNKDNIKIFWPHLVRSLKKIKEFKDYQYFDLTTPYGYGGPLISFSNSAARSETITGLLAKFLEEYEDYAKKNNYVSEFVRFHPIFKNWENWEQLSGPLTISFLNDIIVVNLQRDQELIWKQIKKGHRYNVKKSLKEGCEVKIIENPGKKSIENFIKIYNQTMEKNKASKKYYFSERFIASHFKKIKSYLFEVKHKNETIGSSIFICGEKIIHYYLSGATNFVKGVYPSDLMLWEAIKYGKEKGFEILHLGGGRANNDSLFEFKKGFSGSVLPFNIGRMIFNENIYDVLTKLNKNINQKEVVDYFPRYRTGLDQEII